MSSEELWSGIRVWHPPGDPKGAYYRTKLKEKTEKDGVVTVEMELIRDPDQSPPSEATLNIWRETLAEFKRMKPCLRDVFSSADGDFLEQMELFRERYPKKYEKMMKKIEEDSKKKGE